VPRFGPLSGQRRLLEQAGEHACGVAFYVAADHLRTLRSPDPPGLGTRNGPCDGEDLVHLLGDGAEVGDDRDDSPAGRDRRERFDGAVEVRAVQRPEALVQPERLEPASDRAIISTMPRARESDARNFSPPDRLAGRRARHESLSAMRHVPAPTLDHAE
jgi:hypothetical protein